MARAHLTFKYYMMLSGERFSELRYYHGGEKLRSRNIQGNKTFFRFDMERCLKILSEPVAFMKGTFLISISSTNSTLLPQWHHADTTAVLLSVLFLATYGHRSTLWYVLTFSDLPTSTTFEYNFIAVILLRSTTKVLRFISDTDHFCDFVPNFSRSFSSPRRIATFTMDAFGWRTNAPAPRSWRLGDRLTRLMDDLAAAGVDDRVSRGVDQLIDFACDRRFWSGIEVLKLHELLSGTKFR